MLKHIKIHKNRQEQNKIMLTVRLQTSNSAKTDLNWVDFRPRQKATLVPTMLFSHVSITLQDGRGAAARATAPGTRHAWPRGVAAEVIGVGSISCLPICHQSNCLTQLRSRSTFSRYTLLLLQNNPLHEWKRLSPSGQVSWVPSQQCKHALWLVPCKPLPC